MEDGHRITNEIIRDTLAAKYGVSKEDVSVASFEVTGGSNKGDNYACEMKAVSAVADVKGRKGGETYQFMAKCFPMNAARVKFLKQSNIFKTESVMYSDIIPRLQKLEPKLSAPKTFFSDIEEGVMMMENLKTMGFYIIDKQKGLDMDEIKLVLTQLALLHATSYDFLQKYPGGQPAFKKDYPTLAIDNWISQENQEMADMLEGMFKNYDEVLVTVVEEYMGDKPQLISRVKEFTLVRKAKNDELQEKKGVFECILHNDSWFNNFMFKKNDAGTPSEIKIIDLQLSRVARPSIDLNYFFGSSTTPEWRREHLGGMLRFYHKTLVKKLDDLGYKGESLYPFFELMKDFGECRSFGFSMSLMHAMIHLVPADSPDSIDFDEMVDDDYEKYQQKFKESSLRQTRTNETLRTRLLQIVEEAAEVGVV